MGARISTLVAVAAVTALIAGFFAALSQPFVEPLASAPPAVDPARLEAHVKRLSVDFHPRRFDEARNTALAAQYIHDTFAAAGANVSTQEFAVGHATHRNVIARFGPGAGPLLVIGAHYDSYGATPGADDNASGVAGLLELARLLGREPPPRPVELVAYALEEPPFFRSADMGSAHHVRALRAAKREVQLMLSLEMIGYFADAPGSQRFPAPGLSLLYPDRGDFIAVVGRLGGFGSTRRVKAIMAGATDLPVHSINAPPLLPGIDFSDQLNYWNAGYDALMITDTAYLRNPNYHARTDTFDTLDYRRMADVVRAVHAVAQHF